MKIVLVFNITFKFISYLCLTKYDHFLYPNKQRFFKCTNEASNPNIRYIIQKFAKWMI